MFCLLFVRFFSDGYAYKKVSLWFFLIFSNFYMILTIFRKSVSLFIFSAWINTSIGRTPKHRCVGNRLTICYRNADFSQRKMIIFLRFVENDIHVLVRLYDPPAFRSSRYPCLLLSHFIISIFFLSIIKPLSILTYVK